MGRLFAILAVILAVAAGGYAYWSSRGDQPAAGAPERGGFGGPVTVDVEVVRTREISSVIEALGTALANESVTITANVTDTVRRVNFEDGDYVEAGHVLVELTREEESSQLREATVALEDAQRRLQRVRELGVRSLVSQADVDDAAAALEAARARLQTVQARLGDRLITAPFAGRLGFRDVSVGTLVTPGTRITTLDDIDRIKLDFTVPESAVGTIAPGDRLIARTVSQRERAFDGVVQTIGSRIDPVTRAAQIRALLDNDDRSVLPGMLLTIRVTVDRHVGISVAARAVTQDGETAYVYVVDGDNVARRREVELGTRQPGTVEVTSGLEVGERVVTSGVVKVFDGSPVVVDRVHDAESTGGKGAAGVS